MTFLIRRQLQRRIPHDRRRKNSPVAKQPFLGVMEEFHVLKAVDDLRQYVREDVEAAIRTRDLSHKGGEKRQADYVERTIKKAIATAERSRCR